MNLLIQTITKFILGVILIGAMLFIPAGTFYFWNAWLFMALLFVPMFFVGLVLWLKDNELLKKRLNGKEKETTQKHVILLTLVIFILSFVVAGLDFKYNWTRLPNWAVAIG